MPLNGNEFGGLRGQVYRLVVCVQGLQGCEDYDVPVSCKSDGGPNLTAAECVEKMMRTYVIQHRISSVGNPHADSRAELGVKTVKRMLRDNVSRTGELDRAKFSRAILQLRNTPDRDTKVSPAKALFGRELRDFLPRPGSALMGDMWIKLADAREEALSKRGTASKNFWSEHTKVLVPLKVGDHVIVQNQTGNHPTRWDKRGVIIKVEGNDQYQVLIDGSRRLTRRNRKFLRLFTPFKPGMSGPTYQEPAYQVQPEQPAKEASQPRPASEETVRPRPAQVGAGRVGPPSAEQAGPVQQRVQQPSGGPDQVEQHGEWQYQPLSACPARGTVDDLLNWAVPKSVVPVSTEQQSQQPVAMTPASVTPRRSTRTGRGENPKYKDFVSAMSCRSKYVLEFPALEGGEA